MKFLILNISAILILALGDSSTRTALLRKKDTVQIEDARPGVRALDTNGDAVNCGGKPSKCPPPQDAPPDGFSEDARFGVRCCSWTHFIHAQQKDWCGGLWGGSKGGIGVNGIGLVCATNATYPEAVDHCAVVGARLCTCTELANQCAKGTGCQLNGALVWCTN